MKKFGKLSCLIIKKKHLFIALLVLLFVISSIGVFFIVNTVNGETYINTIVIDAGHGGIDGGSIGYSGTIEKDINLGYSKTLKNMCSEFGFKVIMTRTNDSGLYSPFAVNKKKDDMKKRKQIIEKAKPDIVISIHMNSTQGKSSRGAQVFYNKENEHSIYLANSIQKQFQDKLVKPRKTAQSGDYYIVNCTPYASVIVECGFLSNKEEEKLLLSNDYKNNVCYSILCGIIDYMA